MLHDLSVYEVIVTRVNRPIADKYIKYMPIYCVSLWPIGKEPDTRQTRKRHRATHTKEESRSRRQSMKYHSTSHRVKWADREIYISDLPVYIQLHIRRRCRVSMPIHYFVVVKKMYNLILPSSGWYLNWCRDLGAYVGHCSDIIIV